MVSLPKHPTVSSSYKTELHIWSTWSLSAPIHHHYCLISTGSVSHSAFNSTYKALDNESPQYLSDLLHIRSHRYNICASLGTTLHIPRTNKSAGDRSFAAIAPRLWNSLPDHISAASPLDNSKDCWNITCSINCIILCMFSWLFSVACLYLFFLFALCIPGKRRFTNACLLYYYLWTYPTLKLINAFKLLKLSVWNVENR